MILITDSGSTKCAWANCTTDGKILSIHKTSGFNPKYSSFDSITSELNSSKLNSIKTEIKEVYFYGAGCSSESRNIIVKEPLQAFFSNAEIIIRHDLEAALKATYKGIPIISCILGTGSNSCIFDGDNIIENAPSLGYIAGDEASGNFFGKQLINLYVNNVLPRNIIEKFENWTSERKDEIIENIYSVQRPNLYLATFFRFMYENKEEQIFDSIFRKGIQNFFDLHIKCFDNYKKYPLTFVGSVAYFLSNYINKIAKKEGMQVQEIVQSPIENLVKEHFIK
ncbi:MAG: N-acetylglucosamine kinase [Flavobacteriales bacterium]|nr:N-acetylglucosamine kinase [Flavobacteriales bacterium]